MATLLLPDDEIWPQVKILLYSVKNTDQTTNKIFDNLSQVGELIPNVKLCCNGLRKYVTKLSDTLDKKNFVSTLAFIAQLAIDFEAVISQQEVSIINQGTQQNRKLNRYQCAVLLSHSFLCLHPEINRNRNKNLPKINFTEIYAIMETIEIEKIKCLLNYFLQISIITKTLLEKDHVTFQRTCEFRLLSWDQLKSSNTPLCRFNINHDIRIEDTDNMYAKVDFANKYLGGGVLTRGCVQEEITFTICPELICGMCFMEAMDDNEAIIITGCKKYSKYQGYARSFRFLGNNFNTSSYNTGEVVIAIDALDFRGVNADEQYTQQNMQREINKAFVGFRKFKSDTENSLLSEHSSNIATGNWGSGAFLGDPQLKSILQWIAASEAKCSMLLYCTFGNENVCKLPEVIDHITSYMHINNVGQLINQLEQALQNKNINDSPIFNSFVPINVEKSFELQCSKKIFCCYDRATKALVAISVVCILLLLIIAMVLIVITTKTG